MNYKYIIMRMRLIWINIIFLLVKNDNYMSILLLHLTVSPGFVEGTEKLVFSQLTASSYSASSVYLNQKEHKAVEAHMNVFQSNDESSKGWCPDNPVKDELKEWLQVDFDELKVVKVLITRGLGLNTETFVPSFYIEYQRVRSTWYNYSTKNKERLLKANHDNSNLESIQLDPPIVASRLRIYPYQTKVTRLMCLKLAVIGYPFKDAVVEYEIPEGDVYRLDDTERGIALNDSTYDGTCTPFECHSSYEYSDPSTFMNIEPLRHKRALLKGGLGVLVDKLIYSGNIKSLINSPNDAAVSSRNTDIHGLRGSDLPQENRVVGWFCRAHWLPSIRVPEPCSSQNVSLIFKFNSVRRFESVNLHVLNSHSERVSVFRQTLIQFSIGGQFYDRFSPPVIFRYIRDTRNTSARWIPIDLNGQIGAFVRITLWFDFDWIVVSEVNFNSTEVIGPVELEKNDSSVRNSPTHPEFIYINSGNLPSEDSTEASSLRHEKLEGPKDIPSGLLLRERDGIDLNYMIAIVCCLLGSLLASGLLGLLSWRLHCLRLQRCKKRQIKLLLSSSSGQQQNMHQCPQNSSHLAPIQRQRAPRLSTPTLMLIAPETSDSLHHPNSRPSYMSGDSIASATDLKSADPAFKMYMPFTQEISQVDDLLALQILHQQRGKHFDSSLASNAALSSVVFSPGGYLPANLGNPFGPPTHRLPAESTHQFLTPSTALFTSAPGTNCYTNGGIVGTNVVSSYFYPPPPSQPLPPLPGSPADLAFAVSRSRSSMINPYAASSLNVSGIDDSALMMSSHTDGSLTEYASASLVNGHSGFFAIQPPSNSELASVCLKNGQCQHQSQLPTPITDETMTVLGNASYNPLTTRQDNTMADRVDMEPYPTNESTTFMPPLLPILLTMDHSLPMTTHPIMVSSTYLGSAVHNGNCAEQAHAIVTSGMQMFDIPCKVNFQLFNPGAYIPINDMRSTDNASTDVNS